MLTIETSKIKEIIQQQRNFFQAGQTKDINFRLEQLKKLRKLVTDNETAITKALKADLNKSEYEAYFAEVGVIKEIDYAIKNLKNWSKPKKADVP